MLVATQPLPNPRNPIYTQHLLMSHSAHHDAAQPSTPRPLIDRYPHLHVIFPTQPHTTWSELSQQALHWYTTSAHCHAMCWQPRKVPRIWCCCRYLLMMQPAAPPTAGTVACPHHNYNHTSTCGPHRVLFSAQHMVHRLAPGSSRSSTGVHCSTVSHHTLSFSASCQPSGSSIGRIGKAIMSWLRANQQAQHAFRASHKRVCPECLYTPEASGSARPSPAERKRVGLILLFGRGRPARVLGPATSMCFAGSM